MEAAERCGEVLTGTQSCVWPRWSRWSRSRLITAVSGTGHGLQLVRPRHRPSRVSGGRGGRGGQASAQRQRPLARGLALDDVGGFRSRGLGSPDRGRRLVGRPNETWQPGEPDGVGLQIHVGAQWHDGLDVAVAPQPSYFGPVDEAAIQDQDLDDVAAHRGRQLVDQFVQHGALVPPSGHDPRRRGEEEVQLAVYVDQADQFVAAAPLVALVPQANLRRKSWSQGVWRS